SKWSLNSFDDHPNSRFFGPKHDLVKKNITIPSSLKSNFKETPQQTLIDDLHPELRGWELFLKENFFCTIGNRDHVNACIAYMLYYLTIKRKFNFTTMILYLIEEVKKTNSAPVNPTKEKGKRVASPSASSSSSSSSDENEAPSFLEFYEELSSNEDLTDAQREKR
ncbi:hypothetical protein Tco_1325849, partial [Tanacetum coccineum]